MAFLAVLVKRLVSIIPVMIGISLVSFLLVHLSPGDPARLLLGDRASEEAVAQLRDQLGLNDGLAEQYFTYLGNLLMGDLGYSLRFQKPVIGLIWQFLPPTLFLVGYVMAISIPLTLMLAVLAARNHGRWIDQVIRFGAVAGMTFPVFWLALMMSRYFGVELGWFPVSGYGEGFVGHLRHLFLPAVSTALWLVPLLLRSLRATLIQEMEADYVIAGRSKGLPEGVNFVRHVLMNSLIPTLNLLGVMLAYLIGGAVVVEIVYAVPGIGTLMVTSVLGRDFSVIQGLTIVYALLTVSITLLVDVLSSLIDPRVKL
ncbi:MULTISPECIES: ABC transporter permease [unclassified Shinella]|jgi:ABC-type dipeptide/oligopeptide/nickel transport system permease component|uniref:ABC transporter permease n=1 Tax=unclassified Shinella TaxID=2643062 RepID=UPI0003C553B7|nr:MULTISPECIES: ABC transporter permease [unclassified Shinella]EYR78375.1 ABC-type dipeptide/oligopeptide/nickel transport system permease component [Shinella sp. DD12]KNY13555.1 ABC transporter permease [Shinella sp. SUS2]KOC72350.1 ABC transporter permease [Shinella sp. GWS1]MCO5151649.1 ABC transporter permease [Shinella sp.]MDC7266344.1 ABC transporter permease [Shinella sp. HY16]